MRFSFFLSVLCFDRKARMKENIFHFIKMEFAFSSVLLLLCLISDIISSFLIDEEISAELRNEEKEREENSMFSGYKLLHLPALMYHSSVCFIVFEAEAHTGIYQL